MARILITSGPTRQYLDPVRYLSNGSSGRMGAALVDAALQRGHEVLVVSGPVAIAYPPAAEVISVVSTDEMLASCRQVFPTCDGMIAAAAPCDYRPTDVSLQKLAKTGQPLWVKLVETPDVAATLGAEKQPHQWTVGFALETEDQHFRAITKLEQKNCDLIVLNGPQAMDSADNQVQVLGPHGRLVKELQGSKQGVATGILQIISAHLLR